MDGLSNLFKKGGLNETSCVRGGLSGNHPGSPKETRHGTFCGCRPAPEGVKAKRVPCRGDFTGRRLSHNGRRSLTGAILPFLFYKIAGLVAEMAVDPSHQLSLCLIAELGLVVERTTHQPVRVLAGDDAAHPVALLRIRTEFIRTPKAGLALLSSATYPSRRLA